MNSIEKRITDHLVTFENYPIAGVLFKDISGIFRSPELLTELIEHSAGLLRQHQPEVIYGIESRGFLLGVPLALALGVPFEMVRKKGKLPGPTLSQAYALEYGTAEIEIQRIESNHYSKAFIVDDVLATGGTARAAIQLVELAGIEVQGLLFLAEIVELKGRNTFEQENYGIISLAKI